MPAARPDKRTAWRRLWNLAPRAPSGSVCDGCAARANEAGPLHELTRTVLQLTECVEALEKRGGT